MPTSTYSRTSYQLRVARKHLKEIRGDFLEHISVESLLDGAAMTLPYENATSGDRAYQEIQKILDRFGCDNFGMMTKNAEGRTLITFTHRGRNICVEASWGGYAQAWMKAHPYSTRMRCDHNEWNQRALDKGKLAVPSMIRDWVKAQVMMIEIGAFEFEEAFLSHIMLPSGRRVIDIAKDRILQIDGQNE